MKMAINKITLGITNKMSTTNFQLFMNMKKVVTRQAPIANHGCKITEYLWRVLSSTTSPKKLKHMLTADPPPDPNMNSPMATMTKFWLNRIKRLPAVAKLQANIRVTLLPWLSE